MYICIPGTSSTLRLFEQQSAVFLTMNEDQFKEWMQKSIRTFQGMSQMQQCLAVCRFVEAVDPEVKYTLYHKLNVLLQKDILASLPRELQEHICGFLDVKSLVNSARVSKEWKRITSSMQRIWRTKCIEMDVSLPPKETEEPDWQKLCVSALKSYQNLCSGSAFQHQTIQSSTIPITTLSYSEGYLAAANSKGIIMWNLKPLQSGASAKFLQELMETQSSITSMKLCMEKGILICGYGTGKIDMIEVKIFKHAAVGRILHEIQGHSECILTLSVCEEYEIFASGSSDQSAKLWHLQTGQLLHRFPIHPHWVIYISLSSPEPDRIVMLTHTQACLQVFWWLASSGPKNMNHQAFQYRSAQSLITTAGCYIKGQTLYFVEQCWPSQTPQMAYLVKRDMGEGLETHMIPVKRKVRKLLGIGKRFALLLTATSCRLQPELIIIDLKTEDVIAGYCVPHTCSSSPDQSQIVMGDCSWLDGLGRQQPGDLVVAVALKGGDIQALTWSDMQTITG